MENNCRMGLVMKKNLVCQGVFLGWLLALTLFKWVTGRWSFGLPVLWWWLGAVIGYVFVFLDIWLYEVLTNFRQAMRWRLRNVLAEMMEFENKDGMVMRSALFVAVWLVLGVWTVTSVANMFSRGLVMGIGTHLLVDLLLEIRERGMNIDWWFRQIKRKIDESEKKWFLGIAGLLYLLLAINL